MPDRKFTRIRAPGKSIEIEWTSKRKTAAGAEEHQSHQMECPERPRPQFNTVMQSLLPDLLEILGAPTDWTENTKVTGVSINYEEDGRRGVVLSATRKCPFGAAPIALNTPHLKESRDATRENGTHFWRPGMDEKIDLMAHEAEKYLEGDRAQGELFAGAQDEKPKKERRGRPSSEPEPIGETVDKVVGKIKGGSDGPERAD